MTSVDIIIVNWNAGRQLRDCLESIISTDRDSFEISRVIVVDNASSDGSAHGLEDIELPLTVLCNKENRGFGAACNQGTSGSHADHLLFLNPDTRLFKESLSKPMALMARKECQDIGIVGIQLVNDIGEVSRTCARFPTPGRFFSKMLGLDQISFRLFPSHLMTEWNHRENRRVDHVMGAFYLVRRDLFEHLSGFDERFFVYLEDLDFSLRAWEGGWQTHYLAEAQAYHRGGGTSVQIKATRLCYSLRSRILYGFKHFDGFSAISLALGTLLIEPIPRLVLAVTQLSWRGVVETIKGYAKLWCTVPFLLNRRGKRCR